MFLLKKQNNDISMSIIWYKESHFQLDVRHCLDHAV